MQWEEIDNLKKHTESFIENGLDYLVNDEIKKTEMLEKQLGELREDMTTITTECNKIDDYYKIAGELESSGKADAKYLL